MVKSLIQVSQTPALLVSLCQVKDHLGISDVFSDDRIKQYIYEAGEVLADETGLTFLDTTWQECYDQFPCGAITTMRAPVASIVSLAYYDETNTLQTLVNGTDYFPVLPTTEYATIEPAKLTSTQWLPVFQYRPDAVQLTYTCTQNVPFVAAAFVKNYVAFQNDGNRGSNDMDRPPGLERLLRLLRPGTYT